MRAEKVLERSVNGLQLRVKADIHRGPRAHRLRCLSVRRGGRICSAGPPAERRVRAEFFIDIFWMLESGLTSWVRRLQPLFHPQCEHSTLK